MGKSMFLDFHTHTTVSDGTFPPADLVKKAREIGLAFLSITDHDSVGAYDSIESLEHQDDNGLRIIPGVEISAEFPRGTLHILGYGINPNHEKLKSTLQELVDFRKNRNTLILEKMHSNGFDITLEELQKVAGNEIIGRPHFAHVMVEKGYVSSRQEAFDRFLKKGALFYLDKKRLEPDRAIDLIRSAGGIAVLAHPYQTNLEGDELARLVKYLKGYGLAGIEAFYSLHTKEKTAFYLELAQRFDLVVTAGSDFHGGNKPHIPLGMSVETRRLEPFFSMIEIYVNTPAGVSKETTGGSTHVE